MKKPKVTFAKFDGAIGEESGKDFFVDGVRTGYIERLTDATKIGMSENWQYKVYGYEVFLFNRDPDDTIGEMFDQKEFKTLGDATKAVREAFGAR